MLAGLAVLTTSTLPLPLCVLAPVEVLPATYVTWLLIGTASNWLESLPWGAPRLLNRTPANWGAAGLLRSTAKKSPNWSVILPLPSLLVPSMGMKAVFPWTTRSLVKA